MKLIEQPPPEWAKHLQKLEIPLAVGLPVYDVLFHDHWIVEEIQEPVDGSPFVLLKKEDGSAVGTSLARSLVPNIYTEAGYEHFSRWLWGS